MEEAALIFSEKQFVDLSTNRDDQEENIIKHIHEDIKYAHPGIKVIKQLILINHGIEISTENIFKFIEQCTFCKKVKAPQTKKEGTLILLQTPNFPFEEIAVDILGPLRSNKIKFISVYTDNFSEI
jgi:hypothetical protein